MTHSGATLCKTAEVFQALPTVPLSSGAGVRASLFSVFSAPVRRLALELPVFELKIHNAALRP